MRTHFTADPHFEHERILEITDRPFVTIEEHNDHMILQTNRSVAAGDRLFVLGDFGWNGEESFLNRINCKNIHLVIGNHDKPRGIKKFKSAQDTYDILIEGHRVFLSHYAHAFWPASHRGSLHLYGHTHNDQEAFLDKALPGRRSMDVGLDSAIALLGEYRPFRDDEILGLLLPEPGHDPMSFYEALDAERKERRAKFLAGRAARIIAEGLAKQFFDNGQYTSQRKPPNKQ